MKKIIVVLIFLCVLVALLLVCCNNDYSITVGSKEVAFNVAAKTYIVNFETDGGSVVSTRVVSSIDSSPTTQKDGYNFLGWYSDAGLKSKVRFPLSVNKNMTLYAKWERSTYYVDFVTNGGTGIATKKVSEIKTEPITSRNGYLFEGWYLDEGLTVKATFPLSVEKEMTFYAKWLLLEKTARCYDTNIKFSKSSFYITPNGFDLNELALRGYKIKITVTYNVRYVKDYDAILDIGYLGSPKYEVYIYNSSERGTYQYDLGTSKTADTRTISYTQNAINYLNEKIILEFSSDNVQNKIYFEDITVKYECIK